MNAPAIPDEIGPLINLCRAGKLYQVEEWIAQGKPIEGPEGARTSPLRVAIDTGFFSLVELLLKHGPKPSEEVLRSALWKRKFEIVELLIERGADIRSISFESVLATGNTRLINLFIEKGADPLTDDPLTGALCSNPMKPLLKFFLSYKDVFPDLQRQMDKALCHHCEEGKMRAVCLLIWAGANPRAKYPEVDGELSWSALEIAVHHGSWKIVEKIGIDPLRDDLDELLDLATFSNDAELLRKLVSLGANPNNSARERSPLLSLFHQLDWNLDKSLMYHSESESRRVLECIRVMFELGAKWIPKDGREINEFRRPLYRMDAQEVVELVRMFKKYNVCSDDILLQLLKTPKLKDRLRTVQTPLLKLLPQLQPRSGQHA